MSFFSDFLLISIFLGPGMAISYGFTSPEFKPAAHLLVLFVIQTLSTIIMYGLLRVLPTEARFQNKILDKLAVQLRNTKSGATNLMENVSDLFKSRFGDIGFYMGLAFLSFAYGVYIAAMVAYFLRVRLNRAVVSIALGGAGAIIFWWFLAIGAIPYITPALVFFTVTAISGLLILYGRLGENRMVKWAAERIKYRSKRLEEQREKVTRNVKRVYSSTYKTATYLRGRSVKHVRKAINKGRRRLSRRGRLDIPDYSFPEPPD